MKLQQIALQLYTLRDFLTTPKDIAETLKKVRAIGYETVQVSGMGPISEEELVSICNGEGLVICATHEPGDTILNNPQAVIDRLGKLGCVHTAYPYPGGVDFADPASVEKLVRGLDASGAALSKAGYNLAYHNHAHEFARVGDKTILEHIYESTDPRNLISELDTYWVQYGGANPEEWCRKMAGRMGVLHCKDYTIASPDKPFFAEVGSGNLNWSGIVTAAEEGGCQWFVVEQDSCPGDPFVSVKKSFDFLKSNFVR
jgi:sugar phosphate isomerase/epimerase